jgi:hypothetical protein
MKPLTFVLTGYCGDDYVGKPYIIEGLESGDDEELYLEICEHKIGYDGVSVQHLPLCHDEKDY